MSERKVVFDNGAAYERFMGRWSRAAGETFLAWMAPAKGARWLDVGCGTGVFTEQVLDTCDPGAVVAVDPSKEQIEYAQSRPVGSRAAFKVADAQALPFTDGEFDIAAAALVINFVPDRERAVSEMKRVTRPGGLVAGYVWDFTSGLTSGAPLTTAMKSMDIVVPPIPGSKETVLDALHEMFAQAGFSDVTSRHIDIEMIYASFDDLWDSNTGFSTWSQIVGKLPEVERLRLKQIVRDGTSQDSASRISLPGRFNAVKGRVPV